MALWSSYGCTIIHAPEARWMGPGGFGWAILQKHASGHDSARSDQSYQRGETNRMVISRATPEKHRCDGGRDKIGSVCLHPKSSDMHAGRTRNVDANPSIRDASQALRTVARRWARTNVPNLLRRGAPSGLSPTRNCDREPCKEDFCIL